MPTSIELHQSTEEMFADAFSLAHPLADGTGVVNIYRNGVGGVSAVRAVDTSAFSDFTITGTATNNLHGQPFTVDGLVAYCRRGGSLNDIYSIDLSTGTIALAVETTSAGGSNIGDTIVVAGHDTGYYTVIVGLDDFDVYSWDRTTEPSATPSLFFSVDFDLYHLRPAADFSFLWLYGYRDTTNERIAQRRNISTGALEAEYVLDSTDGLMPGGMVPHPVDGIIMLHEQSFASGVMIFEHLEASGARTDITANVTVDGVPWADSALSGLNDVEWGDPRIHTGNGDGAIFGWGRSAYPYGGTAFDRHAFYGPIIVDGDAVPRWWVGMIPWGDADPG